MNNISAQPRFFKTISILSLFLITQSDAVASNLNDPITNVETTYEYDLDQDPILSEQIYPNDEGALDFKTKYKHDLLGHMIQTSLSSAEGTKSSYDGDTYLYDAMGQLINITNPNNQSVTKTYFPNGQIKETIDFNGNISRYNYDNLGRQISLVITTKENANIISFTTDYTSFGSIQSEHELINNQTVSSIIYGYTQLSHQLNSITYQPNTSDPSLDKTVSWSMQNGDLKKFQDAAGNVTTYTYENHRLISVHADSKIGGGIVTYRYYNKQTGNEFNQGLVQSIVYQNKDGNKIQKTFFYNANKLSYKEEVKRLDTDYQAPENEVLIQTIHNEYDARTNNLVQTKVASSIDTSAMSNYTQYYTYNDANQLIDSYRVNNSRDTSDESDIKQDHIDYVYDIRGNLSQKKIENSSNIKDIPNGISTYTYNPVNQLIMVQQSSSGSTVHLQYDKNGNLRADLKGNKYTYNSLNQLVRFTDGNGSEYDYAYYPNGLRSLKSSDDGSLPIYFYYNGSTNGQVVNEFQGTQIASYLMAGDARIGRFLDSSTHQIKDQIYIHNGQNINALYNMDSNQLHPYLYSPYGKNILLSDHDIQDVLKDSTKLNQSDLTKNPFGYSSEYRDEESGLVYLRARYYNPETHTFIQRDSSNLLNRYSYANGNPIMNVDPNGHNAWDIIGLVGGLACAGLTMAFTGGSSAVLYGLSAAMSIPNVVSGIGDAADHKFYAMTGEFMQAFGGAYGLMGDQQKLFLLGREAQQAKSALKDSTTLDEDLRLAHQNKIDEFDKEAHKRGQVAELSGGVGAGLVDYQDRDKNKFNPVDLTRFVGLDGLTGLWGGRYVAGFSDKITDSKSSWEHVKFGAMRQSVVGGLGMTGSTINSIINQDSAGDIIKNTTYNVATLPVLGALSGFTQGQFDADETSRLNQLMRYGYLSLEPSLFGKLLGGNITAFTKTNF
ncbi:hypothetical protein CF386_08785 [Paraphotobacterium marinum]|uniref:Uncharacterized protein n=1 Tax=Paraphotobacterium marinum TaxID=1755811 RepID=A0A220VFL6_9GAMM|nr:RHS repeat-associated core domain-containing protein [Paraphotobacterium marinum]ASK79155.1 hypothetical protein CF386_08785 [Paraphotobacterium marinum]